MEQYGVVFAGRLCEGTRMDEARANMARLLRIDDASRLDRLFSGQPVVIKKGLDAEQARRYEAALRQAGVQCELRRLTPAAATAPAPATRPVAVAVPGPGAELAQPVAPARPALSLEPLAPVAMTETAAAPAARSAGLSLEPLALAPVPDAPVSTPPSPPSRPMAATPVAVPAAEVPAARGIVVKGSGSGYGDSSITPDEVRGLCWGGFFIPWIWGGFNGVSVSFLALPGIGILRRILPRSVMMGLSLLLSLFMLVKGRELAWRNKTWDSVEHFNRVQRRWTQGGLAFALVMALVIPSCVAKEQRAEQAMAAELERLDAEAKAEEAAAAATENADASGVDTGLETGSEPSTSGGEQESAPASL